MNPRAKAAAGTHLFYLDGAGVLFSEATQELHLLNPTATLIWSLLEEGEDARSASAALRQIYGLDADRSRQLVTAALEQWHDKRFLESPLPNGTDYHPSAPPPAAIAPDHRPAWRQPQVAEERHYRILGSRFHLCFSSVAQARMVHPVIAHLEVPASSLKVTDVDIAEAANRLIVYRDREFFAECGCLTELAPIVKSLMWTAAVNHHEFFLDIHAGVISDGSRCILLPAPAGSGKSTLTASLVHAGYQFFSDEVALLEKDTFNVFPVPLAIGIKTSGIAALADRFPHLRELQVHQRGDGKRVVYMTPPPELRPVNDDPRLVAALVFPRYTTDASTSLVPLSKCDALKRLLDECLAVPSPLDFTTVEALVKWISRIPCYGLTYESSETAIAEIKSVFDRSAGAAQIT
jgi:hypothetical protein